MYLAHARLPSLKRELDYRSTESKSLLSLSVQISSGENIQAYANRSPIESPSCVGMIDVRAAGGSACNQTHF